MTQLESSGDTSWAIAEHTEKILNGMSTNLDEGDYLVLFDAYATFEQVEYDYYLKLGGVEVANTRKKEGDSNSPTPGSNDFGFNKVISAPAGGALLEVAITTILVAISAFDVKKSNLIILKLS